MNPHDRALPRKNERDTVWRVLWLLPAAFIVHDGEELFTMPGWIAGHRRELDNLAQMNDTAAEIVRSLPATTASAAVAIGFLLLLFVGVTAALSIARRRGFWLYAYACLLGVFALHSLTHVAQAVLFRGYVPGLVAAIAVIPPATLDIYRRLFNAGLLTPKQAVLAALLGFALFIPGAMLAHQLGHAVTSGWAAII